MPRFRTFLLIASALLAGGIALPVAATTTPWPEGVDPAWYADPTRGDLVLLGGDLSDGNYAGGAVRADGALQHIAGRHFVAGTGWWVLACRIDDCVLEPASLQVKEASHHTYDGPEVPGQRLTLQPQSSGEALVKRSGGDPDYGSRPRRADDSVILAAFKPLRALAAMPLKRGPLTTWWYSHPHVGDPNVRGPYDHQLLPAAERQIRVGDQQILSLRQRLSKDQATSELQLEIELDGIQQLLGAHYVHMDEGRSPVELGEVLQWIGDLDGDGRPDLLINHSGYYWDLTLWLSSLAKPGELVGACADRIA